MAFATRKEARVGRRSRWGWFEPQRGVALAACFGALLAGVGADPQERRTGREGDDEDEDSLPTIDMDRSGYIEDLEEVDPREGSKGGMTLEASVVPDAYRYFVARELVELEDAGWEDEELIKRLLPVHEKYEKYDGKPLFLVKLTADGRNAYLFLTGKPEKHLNLRQKRNKTFSLLSVEPKPEVRRWKVFGDRLGSFRRLPLAAVEKLDLTLVSTSVRIDDTEPIVLTARRIAVQAWSPDNQDSVNFKERLLSTRRWEDIVVEELSVKFLPARWRIPSPPDGFEELLKRLKKAR